MDSNHPVHFLAPLDNVAPRYYTIKIMFFPLPDVDQEKITATLRTSLERLFEDVPLMTGTLVVKPTENQSGTLAITAPFKTVDELLEARDLTMDPSLDYTKLQAEHFPLHKMQLKTFIPQIGSILALPPRGEPHPVTLAQLTFIKGGMALTVAMNHCFTDAQSGQEIIKLWAAYTRGETADKIPKWVPDWTSQVASLPETPLISDFPPFTEKPQGTELMGTVPLRKEMFFIPKQKLQELKVFLSPEKVDNKAWVSTNDCTSALIWSCIIDVQRSLQKLHATDPTTTFGLAVGFRPLLPHLKLSMHIGNFVLLAPTCADVDIIATSQESLRATAAMIRRSLLSFTHQDISNAIKHLDPQRAPDISKMIPTYNVRPNKVGLTTWTRETYYDLSWGPLVGKCERVRPQIDGPPGSNAFCIAFPEVKRGGEEEEGLEILVRLLDDEMEALKNHPVWCKFAMWRG